jgi:hypothetical protein
MTVNRVPQGRQSFGQFRPASGSRCGTLRVPIDVLRRSGKSLDKPALVDDDHSVMTGASVVELLRMFEAAGVCPWVDAGWGIDAASKTVSHGAEAVGATVASMTVLGNDGTTVRLVALRGGTVADEETWGTFPLTTRTAVGRSHPDGARVLVSGADRIAQQYPDMPDRGARTVVVLPPRSGPLHDLSGHAGVHRAPRPGSRRDGVPRHPC